MDSANIESGVELFNRAKPGTSNQEGLNLLADGGPFYSNILEISGQPANGKSHVLMYYMISAAVPQLNDRYGKNCQVIFINTDHKFDLLKMALLIERYIRSHSLDNLLSCKKITEDTLKNFTILNCFENNQFLITLQNLKNLILSNRKTVIAIDSLFTFYWQAKLEDQFLSYASYYKTIMELLKSSMKLKDVICFYTINSDVNVKSEKNDVAVDYRINVVKKMNHMFVVDENSLREFSLSLKLDVEEF